MKKHGSTLLLYDKTKCTQYTQIIEEDDESRVKLLYNKTKYAQYVPIVKDNEAGVITV
jgi:hypothetical protein